MTGAVIFDLDGTLVDSLADIAAAMNRSLAARGFPTHPLQAYRTFIGEGVQKLVERALPLADQAERAAVLEAYQADYAKHLVESSSPYPGIPELLDALTARGMPMAVLSNKPDAPTRRLVEALFGRWPFRAVAGERPGVPRKPNPAGALELARAMDVAAAHVSFVGDTLVDVATARAAGMQPLGVLWGFRAREVAAAGVPTVQHPSELLPLLAE
ncbi:MAG: HAD family hydrolase [Myxococcaceae bacterium]